MGTLVLPRFYQPKNLDQTKKLIPVGSVRRQKSRPDSGFATQMV